MGQMTISRSKEDYLKAIFMVKNEQGASRSSDVSNRLGVSKSSTSIAIKKLESDGLVKKNERKIFLTEKGLKLAEKLYEKNVFFTKWFKEIGVSDQIAEDDACLLEHVISDETYHKVRESLGK